MFITHGQIFPFVTQGTVNVILCILYTDDLRSSICVLIQVYAAVSRAALVGEAMDGS